MNQTTIFVLGAVLGVATGVGAALLLGGKEPDRSDAVEDVELAPRRAERPLAVRGDPSKASLPPDAAKVLHAIESRRPADAGARSRTLRALAALSAAGGDEAAFLRLAEEALKGGVSIDDLLAGVREFPPERRGAILMALLERAPDAGLGSVEAARLLAESGEKDRALDLVRRSLPSTSGFHAEYSRLLLWLDPEGGAKALFALEGSERWDADDLGALRALFVESGHEEGLVPFLTRALDERPGEHESMRMLRKLDAAEALRRVDALLRKSPDDPWAWQFLGEARRDAGDAAGAFDAFKKSAERHPSRSTFRELMKADPARGLDLVLAWTKDSTDDEMMGAQAEAYLLAGRKDEALRQFLRAHESDPNDGEWIDKIAAIDPAAAAAALEKQIGASPDAASARVVGRYGRALEAAGRKPDAFAQYLAAHKKDPDNDEWQRSLARVDPAAALPLLEAHAKTHPTDASGHGALGLALAGVGRRADAMPAFERALAQGDAERWYSALKKLDADRALDGLRRRTAAGDRDADVWGLLGRELLERHLDAEARAAYEHASALDPTGRDWADALHKLR